jgi:hypothetical protein
LSAARLNPGARRLHTAPFEGPCAKDLTLRKVFGEVLGTGRAPGPAPRRSGHGHGSSGPCAVRG